MSERIATMPILSKKVRNWYERLPLPPYIYTNKTRKMKTVVTLITGLFMTLNIFGQTMNERTLTVFIADEKKEMQVTVTPYSVDDPSVYAGTYIRQWPEASCILTLEFGQGPLKVHYELKGGAAEASFDYFNPYIEKDILYCEKNEFAFVRLAYFKDGNRIELNGLLESDQYFYVKQP
jgi:hypothetical protein